MQQLHQLHCPKCQCVFGPDYDLPMVKIRLLFIFSIWVMLRNVVRLIKIIIKTNSLCIRRYECVMNIGASWQYYD